MWCPKLGCVPQFSPTTLSWVLFSVTCNGGDPSDYYMLFSFFFTKDFKRELKVSVSEIGEQPVYLDFGKGIGPYMLSRSLRHTPRLQRHPYVCRLILVSGERGVSWDVCYNHYYVRLVQFFVNQRGRLLNVPFCYVELIYGNSNVDVDFCLWSTTSSKPKSRSCYCPREVPGRRSVGFTEPPLYHSDESGELMSNWVIRTSTERILLYTLSLVIRSFRTPLTLILVRLSQEVIKTRVSIIFLIKSWE